MAMKPASLQDWFEIQNLFIKYTRSLDECDPLGVASCFSDDATLDSPLMGLFTGRDSIAAFAERTVKASRERGGQFRHVISNLVVETDGDKAHARCYFLDYFTSEGKTKFLTPGDYSCNLSRRNGEWLFDDRMVVLDQDFPLQM